MGKQYYTEYCLSVYLNHSQWHPDTLFEYYANDFRSFTVDDFKLIKADNRRDLFELLRNRVVYVPKGRNVLVDESLFVVVQGELYFPQSENIESMYINE